MVENHCLIQQSPFDVRDLFSVLATPLYCVQTLYQRGYVTDGKLD